MQLLPCVRSCKHCYLSLYKLGVSYLIKYHVVDKEIIITQLFRSERVKHFSRAQLDVEKTFIVLTVKPNITETKLN